MKLTKSDRQAFVAAVLADVPQVDYDAQARQILQDAIREDMPLEVRAVYDQPDLRGYLHSRYFWTSGSLSNAHAYAHSEYVVREDTELALQFVADKKTEQVNMLDALETKLTAAISACGTLAKAQELLPEFAKYLPTDRTGTSTAGVPAVVGLVQDLTAAGWPK